MVHSNHLHPQPAQTVLPNPSEVLWRLGGGLRWDYFQGKQQWCWTRTIKREKQDLFLQVNSIY